MYLKITCNYMQVHEKSSVIHAAKGHFSKLRQKQEA